jgi:hypothetical protein
MAARPRQPRTSSSHHEPDIDVDQFHAATDSMARIVQRVRGEDPPPAQARPRRTARRERVPFHPAAATQRAVRSLAGPSRVERGALRRAERRPQRSRRPFVVAGVVTLLLAAVVVLAVTAPPADDEVRAGPDREVAPGTVDDDAGTATTTTAAPTTTTTEPPPVTVERPDAGVVAVTAPAAELEIAATGTCWLRITTDGGAGVDLVLEEGDTHRVEAAERIDVRIGNPAAIGLVVAGTPVDLGDHGGQPADLVVAVG